MYILQRFVVILLLLIPVAANAHQPYVQKIGYIEDPSSNLLIKEKKYGDGIFTADPGKFQIRKKNGAVIASSPVGEHIAAFCPSIYFCWAFPYSGSFISEGWYLDWENIDFKAPAPSYDFRYNDEEQFKNYLGNVKIRDFRAYFLNYPEMENNSFGFKKSPISAILSPLIIIKDQFIKLVGLTGLTVLPFLIFWAFFKWKHIKNKLLKFIVRGCGVLILLGYAGLYLFAAFISAFTLSTPLPYMILFISLGLILGKKCYKTQIQEDQDKNKNAKVINRKKESVPKVSEKTQRILTILILLSAAIYFKDFIRIVIVHDPAFLSSKEVFDSTNMLILDLDGDGLEIYEPKDEETYFDLNANGQANRTAWVAPDDGILVIDRNNDGNIMNYKEAIASMNYNGFKFLSFFDDYHYFFYGDNKIDNKDKVFDELLIWQDANSDGLSQEGELKSLQEMNIKSISLSANKRYREINGQDVTHFSTYEYLNGATGTIASVHFNYWLRYTRSREPFDLDARTVLLPNLRGYGHVKDLHIAASMDDKDDPHNLLALLSDYSNNKSLKEILLNWDDIRAKTNRIQLRWAGADKVKLNSRGPYIDAQHLSYYEKFRGEKFMQSGFFEKYNIAGLGLRNPLPSSAEFIEAVYQYYVSIHNAYLVTQVVGDQLFKKPEFSLYTGGFKGDLSITDQGLNTIVEAAKESKDKEKVWMAAAQLIGYVKIGNGDTKKLSDQNIKRLNRAIAKSDMKNINNWEDVVKANEKHYGKIIYSSQDWSHFNNNL